MVRMSYGIWLGGVSYLIAVRVVAGAPLGYVEPSTCALCHSRIAADFAMTGMARSFRSVSVNSPPAGLESLSLDHQPSSEHFSARRSGGQFYVRRTEPSGDAQNENSFEERVDYIIGSGDRATNYLHRTNDDQLAELPVSWYASEGRWGMSPAYDRPDHAGFSRTISYRCMFCHNAYPEVPDRVADWDGATVFPAQLPQGIDCQRCHGPGAEHVAAALEKPCLKLYTNKLFAANVELYKSAGYEVEREEPIMDGHTVYMIKPMSS